MPKNSTVAFSQIIADLLDDSKPFSPVHLHRFSDLNPSDLAALKAAWQKVTTNRRVALMEDLEELSEADTLVCFDDVSFMAIQDTDPRVRSTAIRLLWETNDTTFWRQLLKILKEDPEETVRASAASGLGLFIYLGEIEEIPEDQFHLVENTLLDIMSSDEKPLVKQKSLEGLGFSSHEKVPGLITSAFAMNDIDWKVSALFAMGRSADNRWKDLVIRALRDPEPEIRFEAIKAAGELSLQGARQPLMELLVNPDNRQEEDIRQSIIWSLSQIGGDRVREVLNALLEQAEDDEEEEFISDAIENLGLTEGMDIFGMMDIDLDEETDEDHKTGHSHHHHGNRAASEGDAHISDEDLADLVINNRKRGNEDDLLDLDEAGLEDDSAGEDDYGDGDLYEDEYYNDEDDPEDG